MSYNTSRVKLDLGPWRHQLINISSSKRIFPALSFILFVPRERQLRSAHPHRELSGDALMVLKSLRVCVGVHVRACECVLFAFPYMYLSAYACTCARPSVRVYVHEYAPSVRAGSHVFPFVCELAHGALVCRTCNVYAWMRVSECTNPGRKWCAGVRGCKASAACIVCAHMQVWSISYLIINL